MSVMPGSLDYLYYNGILDHIPYEAYETTPVMPSGAGINPMMNQTMNFAGMGVNAQAYQMNAEQYINAARQGNAFNTYNAPDTFVRRNNSGIRQGQNYNFVNNAFGINGQGRDYDFETGALGVEGKTFRENLTDVAQQTKNSVSNAPGFVKGLLAGGIMIGTLYCLLRGKKKPPVEEAVKTSFWSKLNPVKWFKK